MIQNDGLRLEILLPANSTTTIHMEVCVVQIVVPSMAGDNLRSQLLGHIIGISFNPCLKSDNSCSSVVTLPVTDWRETSMGILRNDLKNYLNDQFPFEETSE